MRFYRVRLAGDSRFGECGGYRWFRTKRAARKFHRSSPFSRGIDAVDIDPRKAGLLEALNRWAGHPDATQ